MRLVLSLLFIFLIIGFPLVSSISIGQDSSSDFGVVITQPSPSINYTEVGTNSSLYWGDYLYTDYNMPTILSFAYNHTSAVFDIWGQWFYNMTTTAGHDWLYDEGGEMFFNESKLSTEFYNSSTFLNVTGLSEGTYDLAGTYDGNSYNISEVSSDVELRVNFTGITDFNNIIIRYKSAQETEPHTMYVQLWDYGSSSWENYDRLVGVGDYVIREIGVFDVDEHIQDGIVQLRFYQNEGAPPSTHKHQFDWISLSKGFGTPAGEEVDPYSWHRDTTGEAGNFTTTGTVDVGTLITNKTYTNLTYQYGFCDNGTALIWGNITGEDC